jgi:imidazolonepropionase-like amidohydrolase
MIGRQFLSACTALFVVTSSAQVKPPANGPADKARPVIAFTHATVHPAPGEVIADGTVLIQDDRIIATGPKVSIPVGAVIHDLRGMHMWPGIIEPYEPLGPGKKERDASVDRGDRHWNRAIRAGVRADELFVVDRDRQKALRAQGITTFITHRMDGIARGTGCAVLAAGRSPLEDMILPAASAHFSFRKGTSPDDYPSSLMGAIALLRQTLFDAEWYAAQGRLSEVDADLRALAGQRDLPLVFEASERNDVMRIARIAQEHGLVPIVKEAGDAYARLGDVLATKCPLIVPLALPEAYDVEDPFAALEVSLAKLKHWELAPTNAARIAEAGGSFCFTGNGLNEPGAMWEALRHMVRCGLDSSTAIAALTTVPAKFFRLDDRLGVLKPGMLANLIISSHHLLDPRNTIHETWVAGSRFTQQTVPLEDPRGTFTLNLRSDILKLKVTGEAASPKATVQRPDDSTRTTTAAITIERSSVSLLFDGGPFGMNGPVRLNGVIHERGGIWDGQGQLPGGDWAAWSAVRQAGKRDGALTGGPKEKNVLDSLWSAPVGQVWFPLGAYGVPMLPDTELLVFRNATVWTNGPQGILTDADVCISGGRILGVGRDLSVTALFAGRPPAVTEIDATGKHLTSGIIDEHSHIAIARGVNEGSQAVTSEVRIGDVIDPDDIDLYRQLAGGVTAAQLLHGSANPIGGQSALVKLRWGRNADDMRIEGAEGFIKFALGENVKRSHWGDGGRFPTTRMGVEQVMYDAFFRAKEYRDEIARAQAKRASKGGKGDHTGLVSAPRPDLELDAVVGILEGKRHITCHSYVQSEIAMLMHVADSMGFRVNTFTHVLEGYKVAELLAKHDANAATFSDWWAYKMEVMDAIPYNAALLHDQGVNTCITWTAAWARWKRARTRTSCFGTRTR